jgi:hypothetical protein
VVSCSNLSALAHGSHARGSCSDAFGAGGAAGSGAATPKAGGHRISLFSEQAAHYPGCEGARRIADGVGGEQVKEGADAHEVERQGSQGREGHPNLRQASEQQRRSVAHAVAVAEAAAQRLMATGEGAGGGEASGKRRGMTVCVAAIINAHAGGEEVRLGTAGAFWAAFATSCLYGLSGLWLQGAGPRSAHVNFQAASPGAPSYTYMVPVGRHYALRWA